MSGPYDEESDGYQPDFEDDSDGFPDGDEEYPEDDNARIV